MLKILINKVKKNFEIFGLVSLILITGISSTYFNSTKKEGLEIYSNFIDWSYLS